MHFSSKTRNELFHRIFEIYLSIFTNKIFLLFLAQFLHSYRNSDKSVSKIIIENRFLTRVKYLWKCVATLVKIDGLSKISRWRWVAAEVFGNSWDCLTWKTRCPRSTYLILKRLILKTFLPPPHSRATLEVYTHTRTHAYTHTSEYSNAPRIFSLLCTSFLLPPLFLSSFPRIHSRIFKSFQRNDFSCICSLPEVELSSRYQHYELFLRSKINRGRTESNVFSIPARFHPITFYSITFFADTNFESI